MAYTFDKSQFIDVSHRLKEWFGGKTAKRGDNPTGDPTFVWRMVTPLEVERLQTMPDGYTEMLKKTWRYKCLGNGWTADVIAHIFKGLV